MVDKIDIKSINSVEQLEKMNISFEDAYMYLEEVIYLQENGDITLDDSIKYYKSGKILSKYAQNLLDKAKLEIDKISD